MSTPEVHRDQSGTTARVTITSDDDAIGQFSPMFHLPPGWRLDTSVVPFVPLACAIAAWYGEDLELESAITDELLARAREAMPLLSAHAHQPPPDISAPTAAAAPAVADRPAAVFVSRGVDSSLCMVLGDRGELECRPEIGIVISGVDYGDLHVFAAAGLDAAREFGLEPVVVTTNAEAVVWPRIPYEKVFAAVLAGVALALRHHVRDVVVGSSSTEALTPVQAGRAIHEVWSTADVGIHHVPHNMVRSERVRTIVEDGRPLRWLRVCWKDPLLNCGRCRKCLMTLAWIDRFGARAEAVTFDRDEPLFAEEFRLQHPRPEFLDDLVHTVGPTRPDIAAIATTTASRVQHQWRWDPDLSDLHEIAALALLPQRSRSLAWCGFSERSHAGTARLASEATDALGPGLLWPTDALPPIPVVHHAASQASVMLWAGPDEEFDPIRTTLALRAGARPVHVVSRAAADALTRRLPRELRPIVCAFDELPTLVDESPSVLQQLMTSFAAGGHAWLRSSYHP